MEPQVPQEPETVTQTESRSHPRWPRSRTVTLVAAVTVALIVGGITAAMADTGSSSGSSTTMPGPANGAAPRGPGGAGGRHGFKGFGGPGGAMGAIHGELVVPNGSGGYRTIDVQSGTVDAVSSSSITVHSADGFTKSYDVTTNTVVNAGRDGIGTVKKGDTVFLTAAVQNGKAEAMNIMDRTSLGNIRGHWFPGAPNKPNGPAPARFTPGFNA